MIKFYQTGTFTVGNRLLKEDQRSVQADMHRTNSLNSGHRACQGCGEALGARYAIDAAMEATGNQLIAVNATGCLEVFSTPYPETSWQIPWIHSLFGNAAAVASGVAAAQRALGRTGVRVIAQGGDGGTTDIGFGCLSGMFERNDDVLYICYDNEAYMNTGVQRSSATPPAARTATTPAVGPSPGNLSSAKSSTRWGFTARATFTSSCHAPSAGVRHRKTRSRSRAWQSRPAFSRCSKRRTAKSRRVPRSGTRSP
jgi:pyruvate ferredoxin oxidoreductase beta subunit